MFFPHHLFSKIMPSTFFFPDTSLIVWSPITIRGLSVKWFIILHDPTIIYSFVFWAFFLGFFFFFVVVVLGLFLGFSPLRN